MSALGQKLRQCSLFKFDFISLYPSLVLFNRAILKTHEAIVGIMRGGREGERDLYTI